MNKGGFATSRYSSDAYHLAKRQLQIDGLEIVSGLEAPEGFLVSDQGVIVVEAGPSRVTQIAADGTRLPLADLPVGSPGAPGLPPSQIFNGITMDEDGTLFISGEADRVLYRIKAPWAE